MKYQEIEVSIKNGVQVIKFNCPAKKNAMSHLMFREIAQALLDGSKNEEVVITALTGAGDYYSSGSNIAYSKLPGGSSSMSAEEQLQNLNNFISAFIDYPKILVAVVNGPAMGIAATTLGLCDVVYASHKATFITPFTSLGLCAEGCSTYTYPRIMGTSLASEMLYFNRKINASEAKNCGFVGEVFPHANLYDEVWPRLEAYAKQPALSMHYSKRLVRRWDTKNLHEACDKECEQLKERRFHDDFKNAVSAFFEKRSKM